VRCRLGNSPAAVGASFWEGEAPAEPRRDGFATIVGVRSPAGANPRDPVAMIGPRPLRLRLGGSLALPSGAEIQESGLRTASGCRI